MLPPDAAPTGIPTGAPQGAPNGKPRGRGYERWLYPAVLIGTMVGLWELGVRALELPHYILPAPSEVLEALVAQRAVFLRHTAITALEVLAGGALGVAVGLLLGVALFFSPALEKALYPLLITSQNVPVFAIAPLLVVWFGYGLWSKVVMAGIIVFFPVTLAMLNGLQRTDPDLLRLFRTMGASPAQMLWKLRLPAALPALFAGLKLSAVYSTIGAVIGEWVGAGAGLGYLMLSANAQLRISVVFGAIVCLTPIGLGLLGLVTWLERRLLPWQYVSRDDVALYAPEP
ncbi:MAG TPA: ABC transporter permease [bacterium]|jgi:ABC-type nitrate/sulfonate/bicarbonate transport system permease component